MNITNPGDLNSDCTVNVFDLVIFGSHLGTNNASPNWDSRADTDSSGLVDIADLIAVSGNFGNFY